jgi:hypothetical protein
VRAGALRAGVPRGQILGAAAGFLGFLLLAVAPSSAQTPSPPSQAPLPLPGFVPPYEVSRIARSAGFEPLAPPLREGTTYVLRATDFRGILMRVVVDARSGAIRAVNRIVADPGYYGRIGMLPPPYGVPPPYGRPEFASPEIVPSDEGALPPQPAPAAVHPATHPAAIDFPPLPRPRPAGSAVRKAAVDGKSAVRAAVQRNAAPTVKSSAAAAAPVAPGAAQAPFPMNE